MKTCTERNAAIVEMRRGGAAYRDIAERFGITVERARQIYLKAERNERRLADPLCRALLDAAEANGYGYELAARTWSMLRYHGGVHSLADLREADDSELLGLRGFGAKSLALARAAQDMESEDAR